MMTGLTSFVGSIKARDSPVAMLAWQMPLSPIARPLKPFLAATSSTGLPPQELRTRRTSIVIGPAWTAGSSTLIAGVSTQSHPAFAPRGVLL